MKRGQYVMEKEFIQFSFGDGNLVYLGLGVCSRMYDKVFMNSIWYWFYLGKRNRYVAEIQQGLCFFFGEKNWGIINEEGIF